MERNETRMMIEEAIESIDSHCKCAEQFTDAELEAGSFCTVCGAIDMLHKVNARVTRIENALCHI